MVINVLTTLFFDLKDKQIPDEELKKAAESVAEFKRVFWPLY